MNKELVTDECDMKSTTRDFIESDVKPVLIRAVEFGWNHLEFCTLQNGQTKEDLEMLQQLMKVLKNEGVNLP